MPKPKDQEVYDQKRGREILFQPDTPTFRKTSRIIAVQQTVPFIVYTDRGPMQGQAGDWLVTNHPEDDVDSDVWAISEERMRNTYELVEPSDG